MSYDLLDSVQKESDFCVYVRVGITGYIVNRGKVVQFFPSPYWHKKIQYTQGILVPLGTSP